MPDAVMSHDCSPRLTDDTLTCLGRALSAPLVGIIAERCFGYVSSWGHTHDPAHALSNAEALGNSLLVRRPGVPGFILCSTCGPSMPGSAHL